MIHISQKEDCCGCHACSTACPLGCIDMVADLEGFLYPQINDSICVDCGICEKVCPMLIPPPQGGEPPTAFAAWHRDATIRAESSSGGVFSALMRLSLELDGVVVGAAFDGDLTLRHQSAQNEIESYKFRGSKYLQSVIGDVYREVKDFLQQGRFVLFSGTPCQVAGLYSYLGEYDDNLLTCDLACHGVPSPKVFAAYKENLEHCHAAKVERIAFRRKDYGWKRFSVAMSFDNATEYRQDLTEDPFMLGFLRNTYLRPSCHCCHFSRLPRVADISLADFWGVGYHHPQWDDDKGTSLVLIQSEKGQQIFDTISDELVVHEADLDEAIRFNPCICGSVPPGENRQAFFRDLDLIPFEQMVRKYMATPSLCRKFIGIMRRLAGYSLRYLRRITSPFTHRSTKK